LDNRKRVALSSSDRIVVTVAITAKKDRATEFSLSDLLRKNGAALTAEQIVVGFPFKKDGGVLGIGFDQYASVIRRLGDYFQFQIGHCDPSLFFFGQFH
jgi:RNase H-fold protein (predicted Holliday junction resolvase)